MKKAFLICSLAILAAACSTATQTTAVNSNAATTAKANNSGLVASSHSSTQSSNSSVSANSGAPVAPSSNLNNGSNPMERSIDTSKFDEEIARAEKEFKAKSKDETAKKALASAYADRAFALTEAAQYRSALGDFRRSLKLNASNEEARKAHDQIVAIFASLKREPPKEGAEPAPLPFTKET